jgi:predicted dehydrogenase
VTPLRIAVVGAGHLGSIHARLLSANPRARLVAIVDPVAAVQEMARRHDTSYFTDHREIIQRTDAAIIAAPTSVHDAIGLDFIEQGKHVLIEKPIAATAAQADELVNAARRQRVVLQVGHVEQFNAAWLIARPEIRLPRYIDARRLGPFPFRSVDVSVGHDLMIHDIELVLSVVDSDIARIEAAGTSSLTRREDHAAAWISFDNGCVAHLTASRIHDRPVREMMVVETSRQTWIDFANHGVRTIRLSDAFLENGVRIDELDPGDFQQAQLRGNNFLQTIESHAVPTTNAIAAEHDDFIESILAGRQPRVLGERARDALHIAERIVEEIRQKTPLSALRVAA